LLYRPRPVADDALPAGNAQAAMGLLHLGHLLGEERYLRAAERALGGNAGAVTNRPEAHAAMLDVAEEWTWGTETVLIRCSVAAAADAWREAADTSYSPRRQIFILAAHEGGGLITGLDESTARICHGPNCRAVCRSPEALADALRSTDRSVAGESGAGT